MGPAVWCRGVKQDHTVSARCTIAGRVLEQLPLDIEADQASWPCERVWNAEANGFSRATARVKNAVLTAAEAQEVPAIERLPYNQIMLGHNALLALHLRPPRRRSTPEVRRVTPGLDTA